MGRNLVIVGALALLAVALLVGPGILFPETDGVGSGPSPTASPTPTIAPTLDIPPSPYRSVEWELSRLPAEIVPTSLLFNEGRILIFGETEERPGIWYSDDGGESWTAAQVDMGEPPAQGAQPSIRAAAISGQRGIASGFWLAERNANTFELVRQAIWTSEDAGRTWRELPLAVDEPLDIWSLIGTEAGFFAIGLHQAQGVGLWSSVDGEGWRQVPTTGISLGLVRFRGDMLAVRDGTAVIASAEQRLRMTQPAAWTSTDWRGWTQTLVEEGLAGLVTHVTTYEYGFVAIGSIEPVEDFDPSGEMSFERFVGVWLSSDGQAWLRLPLEDLGRASPWIVAANESGILIAVSRGGPRPEAWFIPSGSATASVVELPFGIQDLVALADRFVMIGWCPPGLPELDCEGSYVGIGRPTEATDVPSPTLPPDG